MNLSASTAPSPCLIHPIWDTAHVYTAKQRVLDCQILGT